MSSIENNRVYFRFTDIDQSQQALRNYPANSPANIEGGGLPAGATGFQAIPIQTISGALGYSHSLLADLLRRDDSQPAVAEDVRRRETRLRWRTMKQQFGLPNNFGQTGFPAIGSNLLMPYGGSQWNYGMSQIIATLDENLNKIWGKHQFAFGGRFRHERFGYLSDRSPDQIAFTNLATAVYDPDHRSQLRRQAQHRLRRRRFLPGRSQQLQPEQERALQSALASRSSISTSRTTGASATGSPSIWDSAGRCIRRPTPITTTSSPST